MLTIVNVFIFCIAYSFKFTYMLQKQCDFLFKKFLAAEPRYFILKLMNFRSIHVFTDVTGDVKFKKKL